MNNVMTLSAVSRIYESHPLGQPSAQSDMHSHKHTHTQAPKPPQTSLHSPSECGDKLQPVKIYKAADDLRYLPTSPSSFRAP